MHLDWPARPRAAWRRMPVAAGLVRTGAPEVAGQPVRPRYASGRLMSLRPGGQSQTISAGMYAAEHQCAFWNAPA